MTVEEVAGLHLLATVVVPLACEIGLGLDHLVKRVFGLRRAFVLAGAKTVVMSQDGRVRDEQTRDLIEHFYGRLLSGGAAAPFLASRGSARDEGASTPARSTGGRSSARRISVP